MKRNAELPVPFSTSGNLMHDPHTKEDVIGSWRPNNAFDATLKYVGTERGRSAAFFRWEDVNTGAIYPMFITDVGHLLLQARKIEPGGVVSGRWFAVKRGKNYGITPEGAQSGPEAPSEATGARPRA